MVNEIYSGRSVHSGNYSYESIDYFEVPGKVGRSTRMHYITSIRSIAFIEIIINKIHQLVQEIEFSHG